MTEARIKDEHLKFRTKLCEDLDLKLTCRKCGQLSTQSTILPLRSVDAEEVGDVALIRFSCDQLSSVTRNPTFHAVCDGILSKFMAKVISSSKEENIKIVNGDNLLVRCPGSVLFDTGNEAGTSISEDLLRRLGIKGPITKASFMTQGTGGTLPVQHYQVPIELFIRDIRYSQCVLIGAQAPGVDLLIGYDVIKDLYRRGFSIGE